MVQYVLRIALVCTVSLFAAPILSAQAAVTATKEIGAYFQVMGGLLVVLAVILVLYALFKKRFSIINPRSNKAIRVLEVQPLMPRKAICLIEVRGKEYLVGVGNETITLLADLGDQRPSSFNDILDTSRTGRQP